MFDYDEITGTITDKKGLSVVAVGLDSFDLEETTSSVVIKLTQLGVSPDDIIKLKNQELI